MVTCINIYIIFIIRFKLIYPKLLLYLNGLGHKSQIMKKFLSYTITKFNTIKMFDSFSALEDKRIKHPFCTYQNNSKEFIKLSFDLCYKTNYFTYKYLTYLENNILISILVFLVMIFLVIILKKGTNKFLETREKKVGGCVNGRFP